MARKEKGLVSRIVSFSVGWIIGILISILISIWKIFLEKTRGGGSVGGLVSLRTSQLISILTI